MRHALQAGDALSSIQRQFSGLLSDPTTPTPAHPQFVRDSADEEQLHVAFRASLSAIIDAEYTKFGYNTLSTDNDENYAYEQGLCKLPRTPDTGDPGDKRSLSRRSGRR